MPGLLKINFFQSLFAASGSNEPIEVDLPDLLAVLENEGASWVWALFPMGEQTEITGFELPEDSLFAGKTVWEFSAKVDERENGIMLSWDQLHTFAQAVHQTIWGTFIACADQRSLARLKPLYLDDWLYVDRAADEYYTLAEVVFQAVDGSYWLVYAKRDALVARSLRHLGMSKIFEHGNTGWHKFTEGLAARRRRF